MNPAELKARTKTFALRIIKLTRAIPKSGDAGRAIAKQIVRIGTVEEEAYETALWLELLVESGTMPAKKLSALLDEANALTAIMAASRKTAAGK